MAAPLLSASSSMKERTVDFAKIQALFNVSSPVLQAIPAAGQNKGSGEAFPLNDRTAASSWDDGASGRRAGRGRGLSRRGRRDSPENALPHWRRYRTGTSRS